MEKRLSLASFRIQSVNTTAGPIPKMQRSVCCFGLRRGPSYALAGSATVPSSTRAKVLLGFPPTILGSDGCYGLGLVTVAGVTHAVAISTTSSG